MATPGDMTCPIARSLSVVGERWTLLILRDALLGASRFGEFRTGLGVAPDVLSDRLATLVEHGVMERVPYRRPGQRARDAYVLTDAGRDLAITLAALGQWGEAHLPRPGGPPIRYRRADDAGPVHVGFVDDAGREVMRERVEAVPA